MPLVKGMEQGTLDWLDFRRNHITSSDAAIIMDCSPWKNIKDLWQEKLDIKECDPINEAMARGNELEPIARALFIEKNQIDCQPCVWQSDNYPWMATSLDGLTHFGHEFIEIKCGSQHLHEMAKQGKYPIYYHWQLIHHALCSGLERGFYISYRPEDIECPYIQFLVHFCNDDKDILLAREKEFWQKLCNFEEPIWYFKEKEFGSMWARINNN